jgi:lysophospholipase L1-like esterase
MGDSITEVWVVEPYFRDNRHFVGRGIGGQTASQMLARFPTDVIQLKPAMVHILAGTNDIAQNLGPETQEEALGYIAAMVELARANGIKVVIGSVPPTADFPWRRGMEPAAKIRQFNVKLKAYAASNGIEYADYWTLLAASDGSMKPQYSPDGLHPNAIGYRAMQPVTEAALARAAG